MPRTCLLPTPEPFLVKTFLAPVWRVAILLLSKWSYGSGSNAMEPKISQLSKTRKALFRWSTRTLRTDGTTKASSRIQAQRRSTQSRWRLALQPWKRKKRTSHLQKCPLTKNLIFLRRFCLPTSKSLFIPGVFPYSASSQLCFSINDIWPLVIRI